MRKPMCRQCSNSRVAQDHFRNTARGRIAAVRSFNIGSQCGADRGDLCKYLTADAVGSAIMLVDRRTSRCTLRRSDALRKRKLQRRYALRNERFNVMVPLTGVCVACRAAVTALFAFELAGRTTHCARRATFRTQSSPWCGRRLMCQ